MNFTLLLIVFLFCFALWLGLFLIQRDPRQDYLRMAGLGLVSYAVALGCRGFVTITPGDETIPAYLYQFFIYQPALLWAGGILYLLPEQSQARRLIPFYIYGQILAVELLIVFHLIGAFPGWPLVLIVGLPIFLYLTILVYELRRTLQPNRLSLAIIGTIFFGLSVGLFLPNNLIPELWLVLAVGLDLIILGLGIAIHDAFQEGHDLRRAMWSSLQSTLFVSLLIGAQVGLVIMALGVNPALYTLLLGLLATGIAIVVFAPYLRLSQTAELVEASERNLDPRVDFSIIPEQDFVRYTRRALSYLDDLPRLASSPLTRMPLIETRLSNRTTHIDTLARANELKKLLIENINRLKPKTDANFGTSDDWRYYNAVYFPYVAGIKPSRRRQTRDNLADYEIEALDWFRREVPERTLYNWQNKAAELIALSLQEKSDNDESTRDLE